VDAGASDGGLPPAAGPPAGEEPDVLEIDDPTVADEPEIEIEIEDPDPVVVEPVPLPIPAPSRAPAARKAVPAHEPAPVRAAAPLAQRAPAPAPAPIAALRKRAESVPPLALDPSQVRALISEQPGLIEKGLRVHADAAGRPLGVDFETPVGSIDLLARDLRGGYVVLMVLEPDEPTEDLVPGLLRRMGWLRKHLCKAAESVRAIAVVNKLPESATYAAAGLADGVLRFVGYRVSLDFHDHA
jgi:hypothetical protein